MDNITTTGINGTTIKYKNQLLWFTIGENETIDFCQYGRQVAETCERNLESQL